MSANGYWLRHSKSLNMKKSKYQHSEKLGDNLYVHHSALTDVFLLMNEARHQHYEKLDPTKLETEDKDLFHRLVTARFLVPDDLDETAMVIDTRNKMIHNREVYNPVVNTSLDCNLNCWYCYENRVKGSRLSPEAIETIKKNIALHYNRHSFKCLKISFFGGEPFMDYPGMKALLDFAKDFCNERGLEIIADFTTNATLITPEIVEYLRQFRCHFQITLDGDKETHNKIKVSREIRDTYGRTLDALRLINDKIPARMVAVRINFDNTTLHHINSIINDLSFLERRPTFIILKKVWQVEKDTIDHDLLIDAIQKFLDHDFLVDYYVMPKGCVCFAEREHQALFNYDGKVFKCSTITKFDETNQLGTTDPETGDIHWDEKKIGDWYREMQPEHCKECHWFPICLGSCNRQLMAHQGGEICTFDAINLTQAEFMMYLLKYHDLKRRLYENNKINETGI